MNIKNYLFLILFLSVFFSCKIFKKNNTSKSNAVAINLDTVETVNKTVEQLKYYGSNTRISDILHTKLEVSFDFEKQYLFGNATIKAKAYFYPTSILTLDARGMEIKEVSLLQNEIMKTEGIGVIDTAATISKKPLKYTYTNDIITIKLDKEYKNTETYSVFIEYIAKPNELKNKGGSDAITDDKGLYFINPLGKEKNKPQQIWTQGETQSNSVWFPTIDRPNERMTQEIYITVNKKFTTLSNGELVYSSDNEDNTRTDYWKMDLPHAPYLAMMAIGEFSIVKDKWRDKEVNYYVEKEYEPYAKNIFGNTPEMLEYFSNKLGVPYVWNKYSQVVVRDYVSGAMENTSATLHGQYLQRTDRELLDENNEDVISHELFHQWFGDLVTCESWSNLPLNESFATYGEYLWEEYKYGIDAADFHHAESRNGYFSETTRKIEKLIRFNYKDKEEMFDAHSYNKGGQVLHMLRKYVGEEAFFASLKLYLESNKYNSVEIHNLRLAFEMVTGEDLNWFFNQWFLSAGHPELLIKKEYDSNNNKQRVIITQIQNSEPLQIFKLPMAIDIYANGTKVRHKIVLTKASETFEFDAIIQPDLVNVDAEKALLCFKLEEKSKKELVFQFKNAPLYLDRYEALTSLSIEDKDSLITETIISALDDKFWNIRVQAISQLKNRVLGYEKKIKEKLINLISADPKSDVRSSAIIYLANFYTDDDLQQVYKNALNDKAYSLLRAALGAISKTNPKESLRITKEYENAKSRDVLTLVAEVYANYGSDENNEFFVNAADKFTDYTKISFVGFYGLFLKNVLKEETVTAGVELLKSIIEDPQTNKWGAYYAKNSIKEVELMYDERLSKTIAKLKDLKEQKSANEEIKKLEDLIDRQKLLKQKIAETYNGLKDPRQPK